MCAAIMITFIYTVYTITNHLSRVVLLRASYRVVQTSLYTGNGNFPRTVRANLLRFKTIHCIHNNCYYYSLRCLYKKLLFSFLSACRISHTYYYATSERACNVSVFVRTPSSDKEFHICNKTFNIHK